jgi:hypothetical protein
MLRSGIRSGRMIPSLAKRCIPRCVKVAVLWLAIFLPLWVLSASPVAWATNDAFHSVFIRVHPWLKNQALTSAGPGFFSVASSGSR